MSMSGATEESFELVPDENGQLVRRPKKTARASQPVQVEPLLVSPDYAELFQSYPQEAEAKERFKQKLEKFNQQESHLNEAHLYNFFAGNASGVILLYVQGLVADIKDEQKAAEILRIIAKPKLNTGKIRKLKDQNPQAADAIDALLDIRHDRKATLWTDAYGIDHQKPKIQMLAKGMGGEYNEIIANQVKELTVDLLIGHANKLDPQHAVEFDQAAQDQVSDQEQVTAEEQMLHEQTFPVVDAIDEDNEDEDFESSISRDHASSEDELSLLAFFIEYAPQVLLPQVSAIYVAIVVVQFELGDQLAHEIAYKNSRETFKQEQAEEADLAKALANSEASFAAETEKRARRDAEQDVLLGASSAAYQKSHAVLLENSAKQQTQTSLLEKAKGAPNPFATNPFEHSSSRKDEEADELTSRTSAPSLRGGW